MSITDELRAGGKHAPVSNTRWFGEEELEAIADRIDAEHIGKVVAADVVGYHRALEEVVSGYVKLPMDADGVPIHVGDVMAFEDGEEFEVKGFGGSHAERLFYLNENGRFCWGIAENCHHVQPDSWESIIADAMWGTERDGAPDTYSDCLAELIERCKRLAGERG